MVGTNGKAPVERHCCSTVRNSQSNGGVSRIGKERALVKKYCEGRELISVAKSGVNFPEIWGSARVANAAMHPRRISLVSAFEADGRSGVSLNGWPGDEDHIDVS